jgi:Acetyltransferase (GNAT) domain
MVIMEQRLFGLFRYRKAYFPTLEQACELIDDLAYNDILRFQHVPSDILDNRPGLIERSPASTVCVDLAQGAETILKNMNAKTCRRRIRLSEKLIDRLSITTNTASAAEDFLELYNSFARAIGPVPRLSRKRMEAYARFSDVSVLYFDGRATCGHVNLRDSARKRATLAFSATHRLEGREEARLCGNLNRYLHWHELQSYRAQGIGTYDFGGANRFKHSFGGYISCECFYTFVGTELLTRFGVSTYRTLRSSSAAAMIPQL